MECYLRDRFGRCVDSYRLVVTTRCNYACIFCHREGITGAGRNELLTPQDYGFLTKVSIGLGIKSYKITGGEPLMRDDIAEIVKEISSEGGDVTMTSNGSLLSVKAKDLADGGLKRINVSVHSLRKETYAYLTGGSRSLDIVLRGIRLAIDYGIKVKLNFILMRSNREELPQLINFAAGIGADMNIIELIPLGTPLPVYNREHEKFDGLERILVELGGTSKLKKFQNRPSYVLPNGTEVTLIRGYGNPNLCEGCTRLRITPEGRIKTCLFVEEPYIDFLRPIKERDSRGVIEAIHRAVELRKPYFTKGGKNGNQDG
ncbi:MAG: GTP 3',8-cyclase MoaA [Fervidicoccaceae archaeon]